MAGDARLNLGSFIRASIITLITLAGAACGFYYWASSPMLPKQNAARVGQPHPDLPPLASKAQFRLLSWNIGYLSGPLNNTTERLQKNTLQQALTDAVQLLEHEQADLLLLQELDWVSARTQGMRQAAELGAALPYRWMAGALNWNRNYVPYPSWPPESHFGGTASGIATFSQYPIREQQVLPLPQPDSKPFWYKAFYLERVAQILKIELWPEQPPLTVVHVHLEAFDADNRAAQAKLVMAAITEALQQGPLIVAGDFNALLPGQDMADTIPATTQQQLRADPTMQHFLASGQLQAAQLAIDTPAASLYTYSAAEPKIKVDHVLFSPQYLHVIDSRVLTGVVNISDHRPVVTDFQLRTRQTAPQNQ